MKKLKDLFVRTFCIVMVLTLLPISTMNVRADVNIDAYALEEEEMTACI